MIPPNIRKDPNYSFPVLCHDFRLALQEENYEECASILPKIKVMALKTPNLVRMWFTFHQSEKVDYEGMDKRLNGALKGILY